MININKKNEIIFFKNLEQIRTKNYFLPNILLNEEKYQWFLIAKPILFHNEFQIRKYFKHHEKESVYEHSIKVSLIAYKMAKYFKANIKNCIIAGLLHDFYTHAWQYSKELEKLDYKYQENLQKKLPLLKKHGFMHPYEAIVNANYYFNDLINERISDAIIKHMFPLSICTTSRFPKYKESWIITIADKIVSIKEISFKNIFKYLGFSK